MFADLSFITIQSLKLPITTDNGPRPAVDSFCLWTHMPITYCTINVTAVLADPLRWVMRTLGRQSDRKDGLLVHSSHPSHWLLGLPRSRPRCIQPCLTTGIGAFQVFTRGRSDPPGEGGRSDRGHHSRLNCHNHLTYSSLLFQPKAGSKRSLNHFDSIII